MSSFTGGSLRLVLEGDHLAYFGTISLYQQQLYHYDWARQEIQVCDKRNGSDKRVLRKNLHPVITMTVIDSLKQKGSPVIQHPSIPIGYALFACEEVIILCAVLALPGWFLTASCGSEGNLRFARFN